MMKKLFLIACLLSTITLSINAQNAPRENLIKISASYGGDYWDGLGLGYERLIGSRQYLGVNGYSDFDNQNEVSLTYRLRVLRIGRLSVLGGVNLNYTSVRLEEEDPFNANTLSFNPMLDLRVRVTRKVDFTAGYNWKSTELSGTDKELKALNGGWGLGVNVKF
jgi:hypothetical protein